MNDTTIFLSSTNNLNVLIDNNSDETFIYNGFNNTYNNVIIGNPLELVSVFNY